MSEPRDDRIYPLTRILAAVVVIIVLLAFVVLYFFPESSGQRFAWKIQPDMMDIYMGAGYFGGAYFFTNVVFRRRWHRVQAGFPGVTAFTVCMLLATLLHWNRFDVHHLPFQLWLGIYIVTPFLVPWLWLHNRLTDPGTPEADDILVGRPIRLILRTLGIVSLALVLAGFLFPSVLVRFWPWALTPLTARVVCGWFALQATGELYISFDQRWSAWRIAIESIAAWEILVLVGGLFHRADLTPGLFNWVFVLLMIFILAAAGLYAFMEMRRHKAVVLKQPELRAN